jgi:hypothetical protein
MAITKVARRWDKLTDELNPLVAEFFSNNAITSTGLGSSSER